MLLQIRKEQMAALSEHLLQRFHDAMMAHLRARFPAATNVTSDSDLRRLIQEGMQHAKGHDIRLPRDVRRFLECMVVHGSKFGCDSKTAWAGEILRNRKLTGTQKMERIADYEMFALKGAGT